MTQNILDEAKAALHKLVIGQSAASVMYDGRRVEFTHANKQNLEAYIARLETSLGGTGGRQGPRGASF